MMASAIRTMDKMVKSLGGFQKVAWYPLCLMLMKVVSLISLMPARTVPLPLVAKMA